jgi:hypothetical protein
MKLAHRPSKIIMSIDEHHERTVPDFVIMRMSLAEKLWSSFVL